MAYLHLKWKCNQEVGKVKYIYIPSACFFTCYNKTIIKEGHCVVNVLIVVNLVR